MKKTRLKFISILICLSIILTTLCGCAQIEDILNSLINKPSSEETPLVLAEGEMSFHFMMLGNDYAGDCVYVKAGETDILIDAGSRISSVKTIKNYINQYVQDNTLEYVIVTHADQDHIDGFVGTSNNQSIFDLYVCNTIIDFNLSNKSLLTDKGNPTLYSKYLTSRDEEVENGATHYTALQCYNNQDGAKRVYEFSDSMSMEILYNYYYENNSSDENNYSVCVLFRHGSKSFLFTGDLEEDGEKYLVQYNTLPEVELFKAGHHGSATSSNDCLLSVIKPKISVACCCAGSVEYTQNFANTFPTQAYINRIAPYTNRVYVPVAIGVTFNEQKNKYVNDGQIKQLNGNIIVRSPSDTLDENDKIQVNPVIVMGSNNDTLLKDTDWFKNNRTMPNAWKN